MAREFTSGLLLVIALLVPSSTAAAADDSETIQANLEKAKVDYAKARKQASEKLGAAVDAEIETVRKSSLKAAVRVKVIGILEKEKENFEKSEWLPVSERLQKVSAAYLKSLALAEKALDASYDKWLELQITVKDTDGAKKTLEERKKMFPRVKCLTIAWDDGTQWEFHADECAGSWKDGWMFLKGDIVHLNPPTTEKGKATLGSVMKVSEDGLTFTRAHPQRTFTDKRVDFKK